MSHVCSELHYMWGNNSLQNSCAVSLSFLMWEQETSSILTVLLIRNLSASNATLVTMGSIWSSPGESQGEVVQEGGLFTNQCLLINLCCNPSQQPPTQWHHWDVDFLYGLSWWWCRLGRETVSSYRASGKEGRVNRQGVICQHVSLLSALSALSLIIPAGSHIPTLPVWPACPDSLSFSLSPLPSSLSHSYQEYLPL